MNNSLTIKKENLPATIVDLKKFILVSTEALKAYKVKLSAVDKLNIAKAVKDQTLNDGQKVGTALLYAEAKLGELLKDLPSQRGSQIGKRGREATLTFCVTY